MEAFCQGCWLLLGLEDKDASSRLLSANQLKMQQAVPINKLNETTPVNRGWPKPSHGSQVKPETETEKDPTCSACYVCVCFVGLLCRHTNSVQARMQFRAHDTVSQGLNLVGIYGWDWFYWNILLVIQETAECVLHRNCAWNTFPASFIIGESGVRWAYIFSCPLGKEN